MIKNIIINSASDQTKLYLQIFECENPIGVIQLIHGMEEYKERYQRLGEVLNKNNYILVTSDLRGHGKALSLDELGYISPKKGNEYLIKDQIDIYNYIKYNYHDLDTFIFSHSMGTIIARNMLQRYDNLYNKVILSAPPVYNALAPFAIFLAETKNQKKKSNQLHNLVFKHYANSVSNYRTTFDWLSVNEDNVNSYIEDPYCGFGFTNNGYKNLFKLMKTMNNQGNKRNINLNIMIMYGGNDPVTGFKKGINKTFLTLKKLGYANVEIKEYQNMRHEILNENNNDFVYQDIVSFLKK